MEFITPAFSADAVNMGLAWTGLAWQDAPEQMATAFAAWKQSLSEGFYHIPFFLALDIARLTYERVGVGFFSENKQSANGHLTRLRYEREVLSRILQTHCIQEAMDIVKPGAGSEHSRQHFITMLLERLAPYWPKDWGMIPGAVRELLTSDLHPDHAEVAAARFHAAHGGLSPIADSLNTFVTHACHELQWSGLFQPEDYFELTHLEHLGSAHLRIGCRQIISLARQLGQSKLPTYDLKRHDAEAETAFIDETTYPTGGFTGLTNQGSFENLLTSELAYMDETPLGVSLFDLRFVEGELLFYLRDEGTMQRRRRTIHFIIDLGELFSFQSPGCDYQNAIIAQALCLRLKGDLESIFERDALAFHFHLLPPDPPEILDTEAGILRVLLADDIAHGQVKLLLPKRIEVADLLDPVRKSYAVILTQGESADDWKTRIDPFILAGSLHASIFSANSQARLSMQRLIIAEQLLTTE